MMEKEIMNSYEKMKPDEEARERMLKNIQTLAARENVKGKEESDMNLKSKRMVRFAAAIAVILSVSSVGYAAGIFNLDKVDSGKTRVKIDAPEFKQDYETDTISLHGIEGSPEYEACKEWEEFTNKYDADGKILSKIGNNLVGLGEYEELYGCYTQEMADKVDEICEKYKLSKLSNLQLINSEEEFCSKTGLGKIYKTGMKNMKHTGYNGYCYDDGTFSLDGSVRLGENADKVIDYQIGRSVKGTFHCVPGLTVGELDKYKQWEYKTQSGETVLLANNNSSKALIILEKEKSFVVVNVLGNILDKKFDISNKTLEMLADSFDFSVIS